MPSALQDQVKRSLAMHALGRVVEPDEVAAAIEFLLARGAVTGAVVPVDGGLANVRGRGAAGPPRQSALGLPPDGLEGACRATRSSAI